jgi:predicted CXXCH cytochrome family protein
MSKYSILILTLICLFMASIAYGGSIVNSRHDLTFVSAKHWSGTMFINNYGEVCVYCHTPHGANTAIEAPLWNRQVPNPSSYTLYDSPTMDNKPTTVNSISLSCLSCHDGTIAVDSIINAPGSGANLTGPWYDNAGASSHSRMELGTAMSNPSFCGGCHSTSVGHISGHIASASYLSTDLSNDHPISMSIPDPADDPDFNTPTNIVNAGLKLFGSSNTVECSSCHSVHDPDITPFLRKSNSGSALCTTCHTK